MEKQLYTHIDDGNVSPEISLILANIPDGISDLAKVRWVYIQLGHLFSYDFYTLRTDTVLTKEVDYQKIGKYQTCLQISEILIELLSKTLPHAKVELVARENPNIAYSRHKHMAVGISFVDSLTEEPYDLFLDLTLDLFRIQSGMQTANFAYCSTMDKEYDIISLRECQQLDQELGLLSSETYTDKKIQVVKEFLKNSNMTIEEKIDYIKRELFMNFYGIHEAKMYANNLFRTIIPEINFECFHLTYELENGFQMVTVYVMENDNKKIYYLLSCVNGMIKTSAENIKKMLSSGYKTGNFSLDKRLMEYIEDEYGYFSK